MRNTSAIYLINIKSGKVIWTLGGKDSTSRSPRRRVRVAARRADPGQHGDDVRRPLLLHHRRRRVSVGDGALARTRVRLNVHNHTVTRISQNSLFGTTVHSQYMGNLQVLPNGERFIGWGQAPFFSLYSKTGKLLFDAALPDPDMSYRAYVQPWVGKPLYPPSGAATTRSGQTTVYASWNGATQVKSWKVVAGSGASSGASALGSSRARGSRPRSTSAAAPAATRSRRWTAPGTCSAPRRHSRAGLRWRRRRRPAADRRNRHRPATKTRVQAAAALTRRQLVGAGGGLAALAAAGAVGYELHPGQRARRHRRSPSPSSRRRRSRRRRWSGRSSRVRT